MVNERGKRARPDLTPEGTSGGNRQNLDVIEGAASVVAPGAPDGDAGIADLSELVEEVTEPGEQALPGTGGEKSGHERRVAASI